jgi:hypothetical protein
VLRISNEKLESIKLSSRFTKYSNIKCWVNEENNFTTHIFTIVFENEKELEEKNGMINRDIALYFQTKLDSDIERWNLYLIYFVNEKVNSLLKYPIDQDTYCARKIVIDEFSDFDSYDEVICSYIEEKLFDFFIEEEVSYKPDEKKLSDTLKDLDEEVFRFIDEEEFESIKSLDKYINGGVTNEVESN